ncbi:hypothetical protein GOP47_0011435 [Adiantum capillus-veneris]|uniref:Fe2OG dioxygenase domain-containing protein n=1 Tax=Adiantum capillus-veneris TaxID=13818 RepID=A0A9D4UTZ8_ADICA|nr:hypothetical protein GOP47_0011435 [Adiantum capillus-veneris]
MAKTEEMPNNSYDTIAELSSLLLAANGDGPHELLGEFVVPESCRPTLPFDATSDKPLPVLDLGATDHPGGLAAKLTEICEEWGFVQVINHGVPSHILREMATFGHSFFTLPTERKLRGAFSYLNGYGAKQINMHGVGTPWVEGLTLRTLPESNIAMFEAKMWPEEGNASLFQTLEQFDSALQEFEITLLQLLAEGLGVESSFFSQHFEKCPELTMGMHFNYYPPCPDPSKVLGALPHTDPSCLTVLYQDRISGLQVQAKDGSWHPVEHKEDGLLVFVGDILQGWSNGRFPAVVHQVVLNNKIPRLSFLHATSPAGDLVIQPAHVGGDPPRYKPFTYKGYMQYKSDLHLQRPDDTQKPIDAYAGITV